MGVSQTFTAYTTIKMRAYPDEQQQELFWKTIGCKRLYWNTLHEDHQYLYHTEHLNIYPRRAEYLQEYPFFAEVDSHMFDNVMFDYQNAWTKHFNHPKQFGKPTWKSKKREHHGTCSYETNNLFQRRKDGNIYESIHFNDATHLHLPKMGSIQIVRHRLPPKDGKLKTATFEREADGKFYICLTYEIQISCSAFDVFSVPASRILALDMSCPLFYVDQDGRSPLDDDFDMERYPKEALMGLEKRISRKQHELGRKVYGSSNYEVFLSREVNSLWTRYRHRKMDFLQKLSSEIANRYDIVIVENLNLKAMGHHGFHLGSSVHRNSFSAFLGLLGKKLERRGGRLVRVFRWFPSSKRCSECGKVRSELSLSERVYECPSCGSVLDRDLNAARNLWVEGVRLLCGECGVVLCDGLLGYGVLSTHWDCLCDMISNRTDGTSGFGCGAGQRLQVSVASVTDDTALRLADGLSVRISGSGDETAKETQKQAT